MKEISSTDRCGPGLGLDVLAEVRGDANERKGREKASSIYKRSLTQSQSFKHLSWIPQIFMGHQQQENALGTWEHIELYKYTDAALN